MKKGTVGKGKREESGREKCAYCGKVNDTPGFIIGASTSADWTMVIGTGKMTCPECWEKAMQEGENAMRGHIKEHTHTI
jgi:hypothetical protein